jgi:hypothetical protein
MTDQRLCSSSGNAAQIAGPWVRGASTMPAKFRLDPQRGLVRLDLNDHVRFFGVEVTMERHECGSSGLPKAKMSKAFFRAK